MTAAMLAIVIIAAPGIVAAGIGYIARLRIEHMLKKG